MTEQEKEQNLLTFLQENDCSYQELYARCNDPKFIEIIKREPNIALNEVFLRAQKYVDLNMLMLFNEDIADFEYETFNGIEPNIENLKRYNLYNVIAFNANVDLMRKKWKDMPDMSDSDKEQTWNQHSYLYYAIQYGIDQNEIERKFPRVFGKDCFMPEDVILREDLIKKYSTRYTPHRKFGIVNGKRRPIQED